MSDPYIAGLLEERRGYVVRGDAKRVAEVDAELARVGHKSPVESADAPPVVESAVKPARRGRPRKSEIVEES
jgi:hypothetical protein